MTEQLGLYVRRVNCRKLVDDEMIEYYSWLVKSVGGSSDTYYITELSLVKEDGYCNVDIEEEHFVLTYKKCINHTHKGNFVDSITIEPINGKYFFK